MSVIKIIVEGTDKASPIFDATGKSLSKLSSAVDSQARQLKLMEAALTQATTKYGAGSAQVQREQLAVDKLNASLSTNRAKLEQTAVALTHEASEAQAVSQALAHQTEATERSSGSLGKLGETAKGALMGIGFAAVNAGLSAVSNAFTSVEHSIIGTNAQLQDSATSWGVLLGSADKAQAKLNDLSKFAAVTPFDFPEVDHAAKLLDTFGGAALDTTKTLTLVGDVASGVNQPFSEVAMWTGRMYDAIQSGKPFGEAAARLQEMGAMSGQTRTQLEEMQKSGTDGAKIWDTFTTSMGRFGGMMQKQSQNWSGLTSTFADSINLLAAQAGKPIFDELSKDLSKVNDLLASPATQQAATHFAELAAGGVQKTIDGLGTLVDVGQSAAHVIDTGLQPALTGLSAATLAYGVQSLPSMIAGVGAATTKLTAQTGALVAAYGPLLLVAAAGAGAAVVYGKWADSIGVVVDAQDRHNETLQSAADVMAAYDAQAITHSQGAKDAASEIATLTEAHRKLEVQIAKDQSVPWAVANAGFIRDETAALGDNEKALARVTENLRTLAAADDLNAFQKQFGDDRRDSIMGYSAAVQGVGQAVAALNTVLLPTGKELDDINKSLESAAKGGLGAFSDMLDTTAKSFDGIADLTTKHWQTIAGIDGDLHGKITAARRKELNQQRADESASYQEALANQIAAEGDQLAAEKEHEGEMLRTEAIALAQKNGVSDERLREMVSGIEKAYGVLPDLASTAFGQMEGSLTSWATNANVSTSSVIGDMTKTSDTTIATRTEMEKLAKQYKAELVQNFKDGKIDADAFLLAEQQIPARVYSEVTTNAAIAAAEVSKVKDQLDLVDRHPTIHFTVTSDGVPQSTGSAYNGAAPQRPITPGPGSRRSGVAGSVHSQSVGGVDVWGGDVQAQAASLHRSIDGFVADADYVLRKMDDISQHYKADGLKHASEWADAAGKMLGLIGTGVDGMTKLGTYKGVTRDAVLLFGHDAFGTVETLQAIVTGFSRDGVKAAAEWADSASKVLGIIGSGVDGLTKLATYKKGVSRDAVLLFGYDVYGVVSTLQVITRDFDRDGVAAAAQWAESAGKVVGILGSGVDGLTKLATYQHVPQTAVWAFAGDVKEAVAAVSSVARDMDVNGSTAAGVFAESAGKVVGILGSGVDGFTKLQDYTGVAPDALRLFETDIGTVVADMSAMARRLGVDGPAAAAVFGDAVGKTIAPIGSAVDTFTKLNDYKGVAPAAVQLIANDMTGVVGMMTVMAGELDSKGVEAAASVAVSEQTIFGALSAGLSFFKELGDRKEGDIPAEVALLQHDMLEVATGVENMKTFAAIAAVDVLDWKVSMESIVRNIKAGAASFGSLDGLNVDATITLGLHERTKVYNGGGGGGGGDGFGLLGRRASGGPVEAGKGYVVGENRPEYFVPSQNGYILPRVPSTLAMAGQSGAARAERVTETHHHYHLTVNTTAPSVDVPQEFGIMSLLAG